MGIIVYFILDPLEQFNLAIIYCNKLGFLLYFSNLTFMLIITLSVIFFYLTILQQTPAIHWINVIVKNIFLFVKNVCQNNLNIKVQIFVPFLFFVFLFILFSNLFGMIPYSFTLTSHLSVTFFLALSFFIGVNIFGILRNGIEFLNIFLPTSSPILISPLLIVVEFVSYFARVFSLSIRLFANMMAGHALMKILAGFCWNFIVTLTITGWFAASIVFVIIFCVIGLEFLIAFLQAYVFLMLMVVYLNDVVNTSAH